MYYEPNLFQYMELQIYKIGVALTPTNQRTSEAGSKYWSFWLQNKTLVLSDGSVQNWSKMSLSGEFLATQAQTKVVKIKNLDFSYWAWSTPWGHVLSLKTFCRNPVLSWAIRYSVFQPVKFASSFEFVCGTLFSFFWHLVVKFEYNKWFSSNFQHFSVSVKYK